MGHGKMIRVFAGTGTGTDDYEAEITLEHSLKKNSSEEVEVVFMRNNKDPDNFFGNFNQKGWFTPFTGLRWAISEYCNFEGRAIYMDTDQVNFRDISELYNMDLHGKPFGCRYNRLCVMVFDNEKMKDKVPSVSKQKKMAGNYTAQIYWTFLGQAAHFDDRWNCLDGEGRKPEDIYHLHFTDVPTQPWQPQWAKDKGHKHRPHPRKDLVEIWKQYRDEALANIN